MSEAATKRKLLEQAKNIINCLVEFLAGDLYWLNENISKVDRETLVAVAKRLEHSEAPNAPHEGPPVGGPLDAVVGRQRETEGEL